MCGNTSTIKLSKNSVLHRRCKHIRVRFHFFKDLTKEGTVDLLFMLREIILLEELGVQSFSNLS